MRWSSRTWSCISLLLFAAAALFWLKGNEHQARKKGLVPPPASSAPAGTGTNNQTQSQTQSQTQWELLQSPIDFHSTRGLAQPLAQLASGGVEAVPPDPRHPFRLRNTTKSLDELIRDDHAILLGNALIDSASGAPLSLPPHLRSGGDPGSYIVQWHGPADGEFRELLARVGAEVVSYVPNNAYFVKASAEVAAVLAGEAGIRAVKPFEPYYKIERALLPLAVQQEPMPEDAFLRITLLPGTRAAALDEIAALGGEIVAEEPSYFGPQLVVRPLPDSLAALAGLPSVQGIEREARRVRASDLSRIALGVAVDGETNRNYLGLTGSNIVVNLNDTSLDTNHPGLRRLKVLVPEAPIPMAGDDPDGHGTFVANLIAGSGDQSPEVFETGTNGISGTNVFGSSSNAVFRGIATNVTLLALPLDAGGGGAYPEVSEKLADSWLIDRAARSNYIGLNRTNVLISNNSWTYGRPDYDSAAARYDAAVRDALDGRTGSQPLLFVFAGGNSGSGDDEGQGGVAGSIESPGTAKNVITVGALETLRLIDRSYSETNITTNPDGTTSTNTVDIFPFAALTDSSNQVASFSSRGNVGIDIEGRFGRFKPDVVAPGTMLVSARSKGWNIGSVVDTNEPFGELLLNLHTNIEPYRYDSGTTFAAANVSGFLALVQEYFERLAPNGARGGVSPALLKAILINGARPLTELYDLAVRAPANFQGWGLPSLPNSLTSYSTNSHQNLDQKKWRLRSVEQSAALAVSTGQGRTWNVTLTTNASVYPLRVTLVWTDPPGNPAVGVKLVNDLDLVVTNLESGTVFYGNNVAGGGDFTDGIRPVAGEVLPFDFVNNVENVFIRNPKALGREFSITVRARRVNVNAVADHFAATGRTNDLAQDYALVLSSEIGADRSLDDEETYLAEEDVWEKWEVPTGVDLAPRAALTVITNGLPLLTERVGAHGSLLGTNGSTNNWNFYVFTNTFFSNNLVAITNGSNVAFVTFNPPNLSRPRTVEADIDLYVSKDNRLTNLHPVAVAAAFKSVERGGTETVVFTNASLGDVFYIGVKAEDQRASEFSLIGISTATPFEEDQGGKTLLRGYPYSAVVEDGSARKPSAGTMIAIGLNTRRVARVVVTNTIEHENIGDLVGVLAHTGQRVVLNNHVLLNNPPGYATNTLVYDDNNFGIGGGTRRSDGPGSLNQFAGSKIVGPWFLEMIDNSPSHVGRVQSLTIVIDRLRDELIEGNFVSATANPNEVLYFPIEVPLNATNLQVRFRNLSGGPLEVFLRQGTVPQTNAFDFRTNIVAPGGLFNYPTATSPSLFPGTYFLAVRNPTGTPINFEVGVFFSIGNIPGNTFSLFTNGPVLLDDATTNYVIEVPADKVVGRATVSVHMRHPRTADTVLSLVSPQGTRVLLTENRGYTNALGFGTTFLTTNGVAVVTNLTFAVFTDDTNLARLPVKFADLSSPLGLGPPSGLVLSNGGFEGTNDGNYPVGARVSGWDVIDSANVQPVPHQVSVLSGFPYTYSGTNALSLGTAAIRRQFQTIAGRPYRLTFAARAAPALELFSTGVDDRKVPLPSGADDIHYQLVVSDHLDFPGPDAFVLDTNGVPFVPPLSWARNDTNSQWIAPYQEVPARQFDGIYVFRTYISMYEQDPRTAQIPQFRWAADDLGTEVFVNGRPLRAPAANPQAFFSAPTVSIGGLTNGLNIIEFSVDDASGVEGVRVQALRGVNLVKNPNPALEVSFGTQRELIDVTAGWSIYTYTFIGRGGGETIDFHSESGEVWVDAISVEETGDMYVLPEESLELFEGERAIGQWRLDVTDSRTGAVLPPVPGAFLWKLDLNFVDPFVFADVLNTSIFYPTPPYRNPPARITPGEIRMNQTHYFVVQPCTNGTRVSVTLTGLGNFDQLELLMDHSGIPTGDPETDDFVVIRNNQNPGSRDGVASFVLDNRRPAPARLTARPFFFAIRNRFIEATNRFDLDVVMDGACPPPPPAPVLRANQSVTAGLAAYAAEAENEGGLFAVQVPAGAESIRFEVSAEQDVALVARKDLAPSRGDFSHRQDQPGTGLEFLEISAQSGTPLTAGLWYVRVLNNALAPTAYTLTATGDIIEPVADIRLEAWTYGGAITLRWNSVEGVVYEIQGSADLQTWDRVQSVTGTGAESSVLAPAASAMRFFRVVRD